MPVLRTAVLIVFVGLGAFTQKQLDTTVNVTPLPPENIPSGTCTSGTAGYLGTGKAKETIPTDRQIGEYVRLRLSQGYSVTLYPQASGKIYTVETCHPRKP